MKKLSKQILLLAGVLIVISIFIGITEKSNAGGHIGNTIWGIDLWIPNDNDAGIHPRYDDLGVLIGAETTTTDALLEVFGDTYFTGHSTTTDLITANGFCVNTTTPDCISSWTNVGDYIAHADLSDMDATVHDDRYYTETELSAAGGSDLIGDHNGHTVRTVFADLVNRGISEAITVSLTGGLGISWTTGEIYDKANLTFISTDAGSGNLTNNVVNYLKWVSGTGLIISTDHASGDQVNIATFSVYNSIINSYRETSLINESVANARRGLRTLFPTRIISGMSISEDTDVTNSLDVKMDAGVLYKEAIEEMTPIEIKSRTIAMVRHFHTGGAWDSDTNAEIETANYDNGTALTAIPANKWVKALFIFQSGKIGWVYPTEYFNTEAQALSAPLPSKPPGLEPIPNLTAIVYKQGDADFTNTTWQDVRPGISEVSFNIVTDHGALAGLSDNDHPQYVLADGQSTNITNGTFDLTTTGDLTAGKLDIVNASYPRIMVGTSDTVGGKMEFDNSLEALKFITAPSHAYPIIFGDSWVTFNTNSTVDLQGDLLMTGNLQLDDVINFTGTPYTYIKFDGTEKIRLGLAETKISEALLIDGTSGTNFTLNDNGSEVVVIDGQNNLFTVRDGGDRYFRVNATAGDFTSIYDATNNLTWDGSAGSLKINSNEAETSFIINNTAANGDPVIRFQLSGATKYVFGIDDSASDVLKLGYGSTLASCGGLNFSSGKVMSTATFQMYKKPFIPAQATFSAGDTTPSVAQGNVFQTTSGAVTITNLDDGTSIQEITIFGGSTSNTTINDGGYFKLNGNINIGAFQTLRLLKTRDGWLELSRSLN